MQTSGEISLLILRELGGNHTNSAEILILHLLTTEWNGHTFECLLV